MGEVLTLLKEQQAEVGLLRAEARNVYILLGAFLLLAVGSFAPHTFMASIASSPNTNKKESYQDEASYTHTNPIKSDGGV
jgi:hypothetical protein